MTDIAPLLEFLPCRTPQAWIGWALENETLALGPCIRKCLL